MVVRRRYLKQIEDLQHEILRMGCRVEEAVKKAIKALEKQDAQLAQEVIEEDRIFDDMELDIEKKCVRLIVMEQPVARDLRVILTALKVVTDLERIADYAEGIAKLAIRLQDEVYIEPLIDIPKMAELAVGMVNDSLFAYVDLDVKKAEEICLRDDEVDAMYGQLYDEISSYMKDNPKNVKQSTHLLFASKYLERIADHATNICEWIIYVATGELKELND